MRLAIPSLLLSIYIVVSLVCFMPCRSAVKVMLAAIIFAISLKYVIYEKVFGSFIAPDLPAWLMLSMELLYAAMVILFFLLFVKDGAALLLWLSHCLGTSWQLPFSPAVRSAGLTITALVLGIFGTWQAVRVPDIRVVEMFLPQIPASLDGFSIVQLSDIHIGTLLKGDWLKRVVEKSNSLAPDLVAVTGDMVDGYPDTLKDDIAPLGRLKARYGIYGVTGNHEYYFQVKKWLPVFKELGIIMLHNEHRILSVGSANLVIAGIPDPTEKRFGGPGPDIDKALEGAPDRVRVLLAHQPNGVYGNAMADIQLSGHTHGGLMFFLKPLLASFNGCLVKGRYDRTARQCMSVPAPVFGPDFHVA
ncbi:MAG: metallophosphoesterase [Desulfobacterium sp.]